MKYTVEVYMSDKQPFEVEADTKEEAEQVALSEAMCSMCPTSEDYVVESVTEGWEDEE